MFRETYNSKLLSCKSSTVPSVRSNTIAATQDQTVEYVTINEKERWWCLVLYIFYFILIILVAWLYTIISRAGAYLLCSAGVVSMKACGEVWCSVWMRGVFIVWNLLEDMAQLQPWPHKLAYCSGVKAIRIGAESVLQNCVMGRCANLHIHVLLNLPFNNEKIWNIIY